MDVCKVDKTMTQDLPEMLFSKSVVEKHKIIQDGCPSPPSSIGEQNLILNYKNNQVGILDFFVL